MTEPAEPSIPKACVMGHRVAYSRSPMIHNHWLRSLGLRGAYELMDVSPEAFPEFFRNLADRGYVGGNVTTPHKDAAFRLVDHRARRALPRWGRGFEFRRPLQNSPSNLRKHIV